MVLVLKITNHLYLCKMIQFSYCKIIFSYVNDTNILYMIFR